SLDLERGYGFGGGTELLPQLDLRGAQPAKSGAGLAAARRSGLRVLAERCLEAGRGARRCEQRVVESLGRGDDARELMRPRPPAPRSDGGLDARRLGRAGCRGSLA